MNKNMFLAAISVMALSPFNVFAKECTLGEFDEDNYLKLTFNKASIGVHLYEMFFELSESDWQEDSRGKYLIVPRKTVKAWGEGEESTAEVVSILLFQGNNITAYLEVNGYIFSDNEILSCK
jgi:hypothetical protein